jgi:hypothetical protein
VRKSGQAIEMSRCFSRRGFEAVMASMFFLATSQANAAIPAAERQVLQDIYTQTNGASWTGQSVPWTGAAGTECTWSGVTCDVTQSSVTAISLARFNLTGSLPNSLNQLISLNTFNVSGNRITGAIPSLSGLVNLQYFDLSRNELSGSIPSLAGLNSLRDFKVNTNMLTGPLPSLAGLGNLRVIDVAHNQLSGAIPDVPSPNNLVADSSALCPNDFSASSSDVWDAATHGAYRWSTACEHPIVVTPGSAPHGRIFPSTPQRIGFDETFTFDLEPDAGYGAAVSSNCAGGQYSAAGYSVTHIALIFIPPPGLSYGDCTVTPIFGNQRFNVTISGGPHGSVAPLGVQNLLFGTRPTMNIVPDAGYRPMARSNCGATYPITVAGTQWTLPEPVQQDCWIEVTFMREFTVTPVAGVHGTVSPSTPQTISQNADTWFEVVANPGYRVASVSGCGGAITYMYAGGVMANYHTGAINADCVVVASFISLAEAAAQPVPVGGRYMTLALVLLLATAGVALRWHRMHARE